MRYFIIADIHGYYDLMIQALQAKGFDSEHDTLISCGDLLDRGSQPVECLKFINSLPNKILIKGNHEDLIEDVYYRRKFAYHDYHNGTYDTMVQLAFDNGLDRAKYDTYHNHEIIKTGFDHPELQKYLHSLVNFAEIQNYVFVHGWIPIYAGNLQTWTDSDWKDARWLCGYNEWAMNNRIPGKIIYCGHWHCNYARYMNQLSKIDPSLYKDIIHGNAYSRQKEFEKPVDYSTYSEYNTLDECGIVCIDACTAYSYHVNVEVVEI